MKFVAVDLQPQRFRSVRCEKLRKIIHIDMDAFYASIEQRDQPALRALPLAVGGSSKRGVVLTASYQARQFGVKSAMPVFKAQALCPDLVMVKPRFEAYKAASKQLRDIFSRFTKSIEPLSLDEAFLDVSSTTAKGRSATSIAEDIRELIASEIGVTASAGVSYNKFLAKLASGMNKPNGVFVIKPGHAQPLLANLAIERFHGVGPATARRLKAAGIHCGIDLQNLSEIDAAQTLGSSGLWFRQLALGIDEREVCSRHQCKSVSVETTFFDDIALLDKLGTELDKLAEQLTLRCHRANFTGRTLTLKLKYLDFQIRTRSQTAANIELEPDSLKRLAQLLLRAQPLEKPVRLIGLGLSRAANHNQSDQQLSLPFTDSRSV